MTDSQILAAIAGLYAVLSLASLILKLLDRFKKPESAAIATLRYDVNQLTQVMREGFEKVAGKSEEVQKVLSDQNIQMARQQELVGFLQGYIKSEKETVKRIETEVKTFTQSYQGRLLELEADVRAIKSKVCTPT